MRRTILIILLNLALILTCADVGRSKTELPSSPRSREAIRRVTPGLKTALKEKGFNLGAPVFIRILKASYELELWLKDKDKAGYRLFKTYEICTYGSGNLGPKTRMGDGQAPEGFYFVTPERLNPLSEFYLAFNLGYPNAYDRANGRTGNFLMVHGSCVSIGCFAMTDPAIEEIYALADAALRNGQKIFRVHIFPFRMTIENMRRHKDSKWAQFWENLKEGYDHFETTRTPPNVLVNNKTYVFEPLPD